MFQIHYISTFFLILAVLHTFLVKQFQRRALRYPEGSVAENFFHLLAEVEIVFGLWSGIFILFYLFSEGAQTTISYLEHLRFTEPIFVFVIMVICSSQPVLQAASQILQQIAKALPLQKNIAFFFTTLFVGPLLGSFITEPAAMTVTALVLLETFFSKEISAKFKYSILGLLFVNISIGGTLTPYAAPPVLMVAKIWNWDLKFMFFSFGWKALIACGLSTLYVTLRFKNEIMKINLQTEHQKKEQSKKIPFWVKAVHLIVLSFVVLNSHHTVVFIGIFLFFLGFITVTKEYQTELKLKEGLLVGFFLAGLVVLGDLQSWWLTPILSSLQSFPLFLGTTGLTAFTDNAALTFLAAQIPNLEPSIRYAIVAGAVTGGGLTVIANAPNPAGYGILNSSFGKEGISPWNLFQGAFLPTVIAALCFWFS